MSNDPPILPGLSPIDGLDIHTKFDGGAISSSGGALLLREGRIRVSFPTPTPSRPVITQMLTAIEARAP